MIQCMSDSLARTEPRICGATEVAANSVTRKAAMRVAAVAKGDIGWVIRVRAIPAIKAEAANGGAMS